MALTEEQLNAVKNKYLDGEGLAHLWEKIKAQSAKIALIGSTGSTWKEILLQESIKEDKKYIEWLLSAEQDVMIEDVSDNNRRYYFVKQEKGDYKHLDGIWESYSSSKIYRITVKGDSLALTLTKEEFPYEDQYGYKIEDYVARAGIDDDNNKIYFTDGTYNHSTNNLEVEVNNTGGKLIFNDKVDNKTLTFDVTSYVTGAIGDATDNLVAIAEGKTKAYTISTTSYTENSAFNSTDETITLSKNQSIKTVEGTSISIGTLKRGDIIFLTDNDLPDRWVSVVSKDTIGFNAVEGKVDLSGFVTGTGLTSNKIVLGNGDSKIQASAYSISGNSITNDATAGTTVPTNAAIISYAQPKIINTGGTTTPIYVDSDNVIKECTKYAGGTAVTFNGTSKAGSTASFYAPTAAGTANQVLISNGSNKAPTWTSQGNITAGKVGKSISFTDNDWTIKDGPSYDGSEPIVVTADDVGAVPIKHTGSPYSGHIGYSGNNPLIYTSNANGDRLSLIGVSNNLISLAVGESYFKITADSITFKENKIVDYSMTLTTGEIDIICADN